MSDILTPKEAASYLTLSVSWLEKRRRDGTGPPWHRVPGSRRIFYRRDELDAWVEEHGRTSEAVQKWLQRFPEGLTWASLPQENPTSNDDDEETNA